jgi:thiol-disulfide isomerase/thioredoxin
MKTRRSPWSIRRGLLVAAASVAAAVGVVRWQHPGGAAVAASPAAFHTDAALPDDVLDGGRDWINTAGPIHFRDLRGKIVLLDFWTYCCINCHHILPVLAHLEEKYKDQLVVIGVHTAKFEAEKDTDNIRKKVREYGIKHPVINDADGILWRRFDIGSWPTLVLIDAKGNLYGKQGGEGKGYEEMLDGIIGKLIKEQKDFLDETPVKFYTEAEKKPHNGPLLYPGKVLADEKGGRLFVTDTVHNRIVVTDLDGKGKAVIGNGATGFDDGPFDKATFNRPQGTCLVGETLYVADVENHAIRAVDLKEETVTTIAGDGKQSYARLTKGVAKDTGLTSPWDIVANPKAPHVLYIAMAGNHQLWRLDTKAGTISHWAGSGNENIGDGPVATADMAQPSGLATDGRNVFVADSEGSCVREINLSGREELRTVVGAHDTENVLFAFGDNDGPARGTKRLQHCLGVAFGGGLLFIADTYNNKVKSYDPRDRTLKTLVGAHEAGDTDNPPRLDEPGGVAVAGSTLYIADTNNHRICAFDLKTHKMRTLSLDGVTAPAPPRRAPKFPNPTVIQAEPTKVAPGAKLRLEVAVTLHKGVHINPEAPMPYLVETPKSSGILAASVSPTGDRVQPPSDRFTIAVPLAEKGAAGTTFTLRLSLSAFECKEGSDGFCTVKNFVWQVPVTLAAGGTDRIALTTEKR